MRTLNLDEMKAALSTANVSFSPRLGEAKIKQLCIDNGIAVEVDDSADTTDSTDTTDTPDPEKVVVLGVQIEELTPDSPKLKEFVAQRRQKEFPQLLPCVNDGNYTTNGKFTIFTWENGDEVPPKFLLVGITDGTHTHYVGDWEFYKRTYGVRLESGEIYNPKWVIDSLSKGSLRLEESLHIQAGTPLRKRTAIGRWTSKAGERNFELMWVEKPE